MIIAAMPRQAAITPNMLRVASMTLWPSMTCQRIARALSSGMPCASMASMAALPCCMALTISPSLRRVAFDQPLWRSEEHTSELQSRSDLVCRLLLEKKNKVALLDPPTGMRELWYSANPDYSDPLADVVLPAITAKVLTVPVIFFFNDTATTEIYTLSLHDALPISAL